MVGIDVYIVPVLESCLYGFLFCSGFFFLTFSGSVLHFLEFINHFIFHCKRFILLLKIQRKLNI